MKALTCEKCGSNEFIQQNGILTCKKCGAQYSFGDSFDSHKEELRNKRAKILLEYRTESKNATNNTGNSLIFLGVLIFIIMIPVAPAIVDMGGTAIVTGIVVIILLMSAIIAYTSKPKQNIFRKVRGLQAELYKIDKELKNESLSDIEVEVIEMLKTGMLDEADIIKTLSSKYNSTDITHLIKTITSINK